MAESYRGGYGDTPPGPGRPIPDWERMADHVHALLRHHFLIEPIRREYGLIEVYADPGRILAHTGPPNRGRHLLEAWLVKERWWQPHTRAHAEFLADHLVRELRSGWDAVILGEERGSSRADRVWFSPDGKRWQVRLRFPEPPHAAGRFDPGPQLEFLLESSVVVRRCVVPYRAYPKPVAELTSYELEGYWQLMLILCPGVNA